MPKTASKRRVKTLAVVAAVVTAGFAPAARAAEGQILAEGAPGAIAGSYIVVLKDAPLSAQSVADQVKSLAGRYGSGVGHTYTAALRGFSGTMSRQAAKRLAADPAVSHVVQDRTVRLAADQADPPSWGLDRVDQRALPLDRNYSYVEGAGAVTAYVIDTGIRATHSDFGGRVTWGINTTGDGVDTDCNGHGTHVAGTLGGAAHGVAKNVNLVAVKVLDCSGTGSFAGVTAGIDWVTQHHTSGPAVANMSLSASGSDVALERALQNSVADGVAYVVAAGNSNANACFVTPAKLAAAITVNASTDSDARAAFSNSGPCTDIFAPGQAITSAWHTSDTATNTINGTSMAAPHVAGAAALFLARNPGASPAVVKARLKAEATPNKITGIGVDTPNLLVHTGPAVNPLQNPCAAATNSADYPIGDDATASSPLALTGCTGVAGGAATVEVHIENGFASDWVVELISPAGTVYTLQNRTGLAWGIHTTYTVNLSAERVEGTWTLRIRDLVLWSVGRIDSWTLDV
ncbi:Serine protease, subtilisin family [Lentzea fradiae]|uniref:Serine protease, subtilisin family n=1 Tax=Lentzea fradiae TaxID=200378 RepID=A0A1G7QG26_9PSEU|nr:S8 family peptidase [Lentzea fradiae]SDF97517.1 Serine protease, subtilisin family [Lentzea fradiae]